MSAEMDRLKTGYREWLANHPERVWEMENRSDVEPEAWEHWIAWGRCTPMDRGVRIGGEGRTHGSWSGWGTAGCRCDECVAWFEREQKEWSTKIIPSGPLRISFHGTRDAFVKEACRCNECLAWFDTEYPHGTLARYRRHYCRCPKCRYVAMIDRYERTIRNV